MKGSLNSIPLLVLNIDNLLKLSSPHSINSIKKNLSLSSKSLTYLSIIVLASIISVSNSSYSLFFKLSPIINCFWVNHSNNESYGVSSSGLDNFSILGKYLLKSDLTATEIKL